MVYQHMIERIIENQTTDQGKEWIYQAHRYDFKKNDVCFCVCLWNPPDRFSAKNTAVSPYVLFLPAEVGRPIIYHFQIESRFRFFRRSFLFYPEK